MDNDDGVFFIDCHYYACECRRAYDHTFIENPPKLSEYAPAARIPMDEVGFGSQTREGLDAVESGSAAYFKGHRKDDPAILGLRFFADRMPLGTAIISPDGCVYILADIEDCNREIEIRKICQKERAPIGRLFSLIKVNDNVCAVEIPGCDREVQEWVDKYFSWKAG